MIFEQLRENLRTPYIPSGFSSRLSMHEAIKAQLYVLGFRLHLIPVLEASCNHNADLSRIDCLFLNGNNVICGIEVDYSIKAKSIKKLCQFESEVEKIIISYGREAARSKAVYRHKEHLVDIKHFILYPI